MTMMLIFALTMVLVVPKECAVPQNSQNTGDFQKELLEAHNDHRKAGSMNEVKWEKSLEEKAKIRVEFLCNLSKSKPKNDKAFVMFNTTYNKNEDLDDVVEKEFEQFYDESLKWFKYPGNKNMRECFLKQQNTDLDKVDDYHGSGQMMMFLGHAMNSNLQNVGCYGMEKCSATNEVTIAVCEYDKNLKPDEAIFNETVFQNLCKNEAPNWSSCDNKLEKTCKANKSPGKNRSGKNPPSNNTSNPPSNNTSNPPSSNPSNPPSNNPSNPTSNNPSNLPSSNPSIPPSSNPSNPPSNNPSNPSGKNPSGKNPPSNNLPSKNSPSNNSNSSLEDVFLELHNEHRKNGGIDQLKWDPNLEQSAQDTVEMKCNQSNNASPLLPGKKVEWTMRMTMPQNKDNTTVAQEMFARLYDNITSFYSYPGEENWTNCFQNPSEDEVTRLLVIMRILHENFTGVGCALKNCDANTQNANPDVTYAMSCTYENDTEPTDPVIFREYQFINLCQFELGKWRSCKQKLEKDCQDQANLVNKPGPNGYYPQPLPVGPPATKPGGFPAFPQPASKTNGSKEKDLTQIQRLHKKFHEWHNEVMD